MNKLLKRLLDTPEPIFSDALHGLEREALRVDAAGHLALTPHPTSLGSALTHPYITTDFSDAQIEYTTLPHASLERLLEEMEVLCHFVRLRLGAELLWPFSMPARLPPTEQIPLANYGSSPLGRYKHIYRRGLAHRYGSRMQTISGVHYNFSFGQAFWEAYFRLLGKEATPAHISEAYLGIIRNFLRYAYVFPYLFGDSPILDQSLIADPSASPSISTARQRLLSEKARAKTLYTEYATSLRQSELGYNHPSQWDLQIGYNSLDAYLKEMCQAITQPHPDYSRWSVEDGEQLNTNRLQIENEHYAIIRPKPGPLKEGERPLQSLERHGIRYLELRCLDMQSLSCCGTDQASLCFAQLLLYYCLLTPSPPLYSAEDKRLRENYLRVVWEGRSPNCNIALKDKSSPLRTEGLALCDQLQDLAQRLDTECGQYLYSSSLAAQKEKFLNIEATPSAISLATLRQYPGGYLDFGLDQAQKHLQNAHGFTFSTKQKENLDSLGLLSQAKQQELEQENKPAPDLKQLPLS